MLVTAGSSVKFWSTENYDLIHELSSNSSDISAVSWNKDGQFLATLDPNTSEIALHTVSSSSAVCSGIFRIMENISCLQFCNTNNRYLAVGGAKDSVLLWDVKGNYKKKSFVVSKAGVTKVSFSSADSHLAIGTVHGDAYLISNTNNLISGPVKLFSEKTKLKDIRYSVLNRCLVGACSENGNVILLDTDSGKVLKEFSHVHSAPVSAVAFSPINELLMVSVGYDKRFVSYNVNSKNIIMKYETKSPLTSVCFMSNGQSVAVGTMTGEVVVFDLRMLNSPLATVVAHKGPVLDVKLQPRKNSENVKGSRSASKNAVTTDKRIGPKSQDQGRSVSKKEPNVAASIVPGSSPNLEIISPLQFQLNRDEKQHPMDTPLLKNMKTPARSMKKHSSDFDDFGILSPLDKENKSPVVVSLSATNDRRILIKPTLMDGLLSPIKSPPASNSSNTRSSFNRSISKNTNINLSEKSVKQAPLRPEFIDDLLSPLKYDSDKDESSTKKESEALINPLTPDEKSPKNSSKAGRRRSSSVERVKRVLLNRSECNIDYNCALNLEYQKGLRETVERCTSPEKEKLVSQIEYEERSGNQDDGMGGGILEMSTTLPSRVNENASNLSSSLNKVVTDKDLGSEEAKVKATNGKQKILVREDFDNLEDDEEEAFKIAFPSDKILAEERERCHLEKSLPSKNIENCNANNVNLELIKNCVADALERHEFEVNKRFMHVQYTMIKHFINLKREMHKCFREHSINEELLQENARLRDEINKLKCTY